MPTSLQTQIHSALKIAIAFVPWVAAMYVFYWLDSSGTWTAETPHRGKISVALLGAGMALSFLVWSHFARQQER